MEVVMMVDVTGGEGDCGVRVLSTGEGSGSQDEYTTAGFTVFGDVPMLPGMDLGGECRPPHAHSHILLA